MHSNDEFRVLENTYHPSKCSTDSGGRGETQSGMIYHGIVEVIDLEVSIF